MRSLKWLSNLFIASRATFCSCNSAIKPKGVPKSSNKLTYKISTHLKLCSIKAKDVKEVRKSDKTKNAIPPKVKAKSQSDKFSTGVQLSARKNLQPTRVRKLHFKEIVRPYNSRKSTQAKILTSRLVKESATKTFPTTLKSSLSGLKYSLESKDTKRGLKSIDGILKEANDISYKLNDKRKEAVGIHQNKLKYIEGFDEHVRVNANKTKVGVKVIKSMTNVRANSDKSSTKKYRTKYTRGPSKNVNLTSQKKYSKNKAEEVSKTKKNPYYTFQKTASSKIKDTKPIMWFPFDQHTAVYEQSLKNQPIKIKVLPDRKEENLFNNLDGFIGDKTKENIKIFPKKVLKYNLKTEESKAYHEIKNPGKCINNETINPKDGLPENNENTSITVELSDVVLNPKYLNVKDKLFTKKDRVDIAEQLKNYSKSNEQRNMACEMERKSEQKNDFRHSEKNVLVDLWKSSRMTLPRSTKEKNFVKTRRIRAATPSNVSQLLKHPDRSPRKISYLKKVNDTTNANSNIKIPMNTTLVKGCSSKTTPIQRVDGLYVNPSNSFKTNIHKLFNKNNKYARWSPFTKNRNRKSKCPVKSAGDVIYINSVTTNLQDGKIEFDSNIDDDITSPSILSTNLISNENRFSDAYKKKTSPVDPLLCSQKRNYLSLTQSKRKHPMFVVQKPSIMVYKKSMKTNVINNDTLVLKKKPQKDESKCLNARDYRNNGDKCLFATKCTKKIEPEEKVLNTKSAENKMITVKVLPCPNGKKRSANEFRQNQEWSELPANIEDKWTAYLNSKSRSDLTNRCSTEAQFFNRLLSHSLANYGVIHLEQTPSPKPMVKDITDNYLSEKEEKSSIFRPIISHLSKEKNHLDLGKEFSRE